jgi:asparagine synthase (glutamine-hydrolysing)
MCGIAANVSSMHRIAVNAMLEAIPHRGPDDRGVYSDDNSGLSIGMNRLSIIDLAQGRQPLSNEDETVWVVCNGEIFNSPKLRENLEQRGHLFRSRNSDVEVIPHLYEEHGEDFIRYLDGMFACILFDLRRQTLIAARDRFGIKPLYYQVNPSGISFASELKAILRVPGVAKTLDRQSLSDYLSFQFIPAPRTPYEGISKLGAAERLVYGIEENRFEIDRYWHLKIKPTFQSNEQVIHELREEISAAVDRWSLSDVPIAVSLSGGIDSAALVGLLASKQNSRIRTYTLGFKSPLDDDQNELEAARLTSQRWQTEHTEIVIDPQEVINDLPLMTYHLDEPYGGGLPSWYIYQAMRGQVKVCHTGTGADELFGNYGKAAAFRALGHKSFRRELKRSLKEHSLSNLIYLLRFPNAYRSWMFIREPEKRDFLFDRMDSLSGCKPSELYVEQHFQEHRNYSIEDSIADFDFRNQLPEEFLHVTDRFSMAHAIEARVPFLDHHFVEKVMRIPAKQRIGLESPKEILKQVLKPFVAPEILSRRKHGFILPLTRWTRNELRSTIEEVFSSSYLKRQGLFNPNIRRYLYKPHLDGAVDETQRVWTFFMFQQWHQVFFG